VRVGGEKVTTHVQSDDNASSPPDDHREVVSDVPSREALVDDHRGDVVEGYERVRGGHGKQDSAGGVGLGTQVLEE
jgi:hypothetical protein